MSLVLAGLGASVVVSKDDIHPSFRWLLRFGVERYGFLCLVINEARCLAMRT